MSRIHIQTVQFFLLHVPVQLIDRKIWHDYLSCSYAVESVGLACKYAYKDVEEDITLGGN
jgi:hypothetical protein